MKKLVIFDLDGTLAESKMPVDAEMASLIIELLGVMRVAIISGGDWPQFEKQLLANLPTAPPNNQRLANLSIAPTSGAKLFRYENGWKQLYAEELSATEKKSIIAALEAALVAADFPPERHWGERIEDRGTQITLSALGQAAPLDAKQQWDPDFAKRKRLKAILDPLLPGLSVRIGGSTSIDISRPGMDKAYGIRKLRDVLDIPLADMLFVGDALFEGGNDYPAKQAGVDCLAVRDPSDSKLVIRTLLKTCL